MKLKYLKGIFPAAEETFLLDVLQSCENNVQKASEKLTMKGFSRTPPPKYAFQFTNFSSTLDVIVVCAWVYFLGLQERNGLKLNLSLGKDRGLYNNRALLTCTTRVLRCLSLRFQRPCKLTFTVTFNQS